jgi:hypothetical protein
MLSKIKFSDLDWSLQKKIKEHVEKHASDVNIKRYKVTLEAITEEKEEEKE